MITLKEEIKEAYEREVKKTQTRKSDHNREKIEKDVPELTLERQAVENAIHDKEHTEGSPEGT